MTLGKSSLFDIHQIYPRISLSSKVPQIEYTPVPNEPGCRCSDIQIYLDVLELMHTATGGKGVQVLFRVLNRHSECPELLVIP